MNRDSREMPTSDEELACRAQQGCAESFEQLLRRFQTPVLHFLRHRGFFADAEDLTQETFLRAYENLHRYNRRWAFSTWLFTIARRTSLNHRRRRSPDAPIARRSRRRGRLPPSRWTRWWPRRAARGFGIARPAFSPRSRRPPCGCTTSRTCRPARLPRCWGDPGRRSRSCCFAPASGFCRCSASLTTSGGKRTEIVQFSCERKWDCPL